MSRAKLGLQLRRAGLGTHADPEEGELAGVDCRKFTTGAGLQQQDGARRDQSALDRSATS
ncbi:MAG: hypothetical protein ACRCXL_06890 [Dermatophilaceae bacterium]